MQAFIATRLVKPRLMARRREPRPRSSGRRKDNAFDRLIRLRAALPSVPQDIKVERASMNTDYDRIAELYQRARPRPWRTHIECYTLLRLVGDVAGKAVIDLACGEGHYTRILRQLGASRIVGVDRAAQDWARRGRMSRRPLGIEYRVETSGHWRCPESSIGLRGVSPQLCPLRGRVDADVPRGGPHTEARRPLRDGQRGPGRADCRLPRRPATTASRSASRAS